MFNIFVKVHNGNNRKNGNGGSSLIEVIVSMLILSIVVVPLLTNFSVTVRTNINAKEVKEATDFSQQLMETLQAYGAESVNAQFWKDQTYSVNDGLKTEEVSYNKDEAFKIVSGLSSEDFAATDSNYSDEQATAYTNNSPRYYTILGAKENNRDYDVQIEYNPNAYGSSGIPAESAHAYNVTVSLMYLLSVKIQLLLSILMEHL